MRRNYPDWLKAFLEYTSYAEAPRYMHFWTGVSTIAGALQRKVWFDMGYSQWTPNFYILLIAPPGIVAKSTTAGMGMNLLRQVPGIKFGPDVVTWPALISGFAEATEAFEYGGSYHTQSALTFESSEFGNLFNPKDKDMVDLLVSLWDGKQGAFEKRTKTSGNDSVENPWINLIACTTPAWIALNCPEYMIGGGFFSRCLCIYAEEKARLSPYPKRCAGQKLQEMAPKLIEDLCRISELKGEFHLTEDAYTWGEKWYENHFKVRPKHLDDDRFGGYIARKQSHIHKLAMVLSVATSSTLIITKETLEIANQMVTDLEQDMAKSFAKIGKSDTSAYVDRLLEFIGKRDVVPYTEVYHYVHSHFPKARDFEDVIAGCIKSGKLQIMNEGGKCLLKRLKA